MSLLIKKNSVEETRQLYSDPAGNLILVWVVAGDKHFLLGGILWPEWGLCSNLPSPF